MGFAVANRHWTQLSLDPFHETAPNIAVELPLWLLLFVGIFIGVFAGWFFCWLAQGKYRRLARERAREVTRLNTELAEARQGPQRMDAQMLAPLPGIMP
ncbi:LapA family protein [Aestuariivirga litoralis]|nr:LapA family protein [Aestuariivirga litoralis]